MMSTKTEMLQNLLALLKSEETPQVFDNWSSWDDYYKAPVVCSRLTSPPTWNGYFHVVATVDSETNRQLLEDGFYAEPLEETEETPEYLLEEIQQINAEKVAMRRNTVFWPIVEALGGMKIFDGSSNKVALIETLQLITSNQVELQFCHNLKKAAAQGIDGYTMNRIYHAFRHVDCDSEQAYLARKKAA